MIYLLLAYEFAKVGLFTVGGGLASLPFLYDISDRLGWFSHAELLNMIAVSESTPGPIGLNIATYAGFTTAGVLGSVVATLSLMLPSLIIVVIISRLLTKFQQSSLVQSAFYGIRPASTGLIAAAGISIFRTTMLRLELYGISGNFVDIFNLPNLCIGAILLFSAIKFKISPIWLVLAGAVLGVVFKLS